MSDQLKTRRGFLPTVLAASLILNAGFSVAAYRHFDFTHTRSATQPLTVGSDAPIVIAKDLTGRDITIRIADKPTVLYILSPICAWCARNTANITALWRQKSADYTFIGLSLKGERLNEYLAQNPLPFDTYVADPKTIAAYRLGVTPSTIVVSKEGKVLRKFNGAFDRSLATVEAFFGVKLPGIQPGAESNPEPVAAVQPM